MIFRRIPIGLIKVGKNVRCEEDNELGELIDSVHRLDLITPILVRPVKDRYELIVGHRRLLALKANGDDLIPCVIRNDISDNDKIYIQLSENTQRKQLSAFELVDTFDRLKAVTPGLTNVQIAAMIGRSATWVQNQYAAVKIAEGMKDHDEKTDHLTAGQIIGRAERSGFTGLSGGQGGRPRKWQIRRTGACTVQVECPDKETTDQLLTVLREFKRRGVKIFEGVA